MNRKILVTGGSGFIGSYLVKKLVQLDNDVTIYSRMSSKKLIEDIYTKIKITKGDITNKQQLEKALKENFDLVINLASNPFVDIVSKFPEEDAKTSIDGTLNILENIRQKKTPLIYFSTSMVYGKPIELPITELHPANPTTQYGRNRLTSEQYCKDYYKKFGIKYLIIRPSQVYGPGRLPLPSSRSGVVGIFVNKLLDNQNIEINGKGDLLRDFIYIDDVVNATIHLIEKEKYGEIFNIGSGKPTTLKELAELCMKKIKPESAKILYKDPIASDTDFYLSIDKLRNSGFAPKVSLNEGLDRYIDWCKKN